MRWRSIFPIFVASMVIGIGSLAGASNSKGVPVGPPAGSHAGSPDGQSAAAAGRVTGGLPENPGRILVQEIMGGGAQDVPADVYAALSTLGRHPIGLQVAMQVYAARQVALQAYGAQQVGLQTYAAGAVEGQDQTVAPTFKDLGSFGWSSGAVGALAQAGVLAGVGNGDFNPAGTVTREELATTLMRIRGEAAQSSAEPLPGVAGWAQASMQAAVRDGILQGNGQGLDPTGPVSRYQALTLITRAFGLAPQSANDAGTSISLKTHAPIPAWAQGAAALSLRLGLVQGEGGYLNGNETITRAQLAVLLDRVLELEAATN